MTTIISGASANFTVTVKSDGVPVAVSDATARVFTLDGRTELVAETSLSSSEAGANWPAGIVAVTLDAAATGAIPAGEAILVLTGSFGIKRFKLNVETLSSPIHSSLFIKDIIVDEIRADQLVMASSGALPTVSISDDYIWRKITASESEIGHMLRVPLVPTKFFPGDPTPEQIAALNGMPWEVESSPDYEAAMFEGDRWGYIVMRQKPIISVDKIRFAYPSQNVGYFDIQNEWIRVDKKYGHVRIVPSSNAVLTSLAGVIMMNLAGGRTIPNMVRVEYTAGLTDVENNWPELLDAIKKNAVLKIISDAFLPQSGSISADGLSESMSVDMDKYHQDINTILNGPDGSNGGLMAKIHGIRMMVM